MSDLLEALERADAALLTIRNSSPISEDLAQQLFVMRATMRKEIAALKRKLSIEDEKRLRAWNDAWRYADRQEMRIP